MRSAKRYLVVLLAVVLFPFQSIYAQIVWNNRCQFEESHSFVKCKGKKCAFNNMIHLGLLPYSIIELKCSSLGDMTELSGKLVMHHNYDVENDTMLSYYKLKEKIYIYGCNLLKNDNRKLRKEQLLAIVDEEGNFGLMDIFAAGIF